MSLFSRLVTVVDRVQHTSTSHIICAVQLKRLYNESDADEFLEVFKKYMMRFLRVDYKITNRCCERSVDFICTFVSNAMGPENTEANDDADDSIMETAFQTKVFDYLLYVQSADDKTLRFRACQILTKLFALMIENTLSVEMCDKLQSALIERFADSCLAVRLQAANCLYHLQDPKDSNNPVLQIYLDHIRYDSSAKIRSICIEKIAMRKDVLKTLVDSTRDIDASVRLAAFKRLSKAFPKHLEIVDRQTVILGVLNDTCNRNIDFVETKLIPKWLERYNDKYMDFFAAFRLDSVIIDMRNTLKIMRFVTKALFNLNPVRDVIEILDLNQDQCIPLKSLNWDSVLFWRCLVDLIYEKSKTDDSFDQILHELLLPELMKFIKYMQEYIEANGIPLTNPPVYRTSYPNPYSEQAPIDECQFVIRQLFCITKVFVDDFSDSVIRHTFNTLIANSLKCFSFDMETIETMVMGGLQLSIPIVNDRIKFICELIAEITEPTTIADSEVFLVPEVPAIPMPVEGRTTKAKLDNNAIKMMFNHHDYSFQLAQLKLDCHRISNMIEEALTNADYLGANEYKVEKNKVQDKIQEVQTLMNPPETVKSDAEPDEDPIMALFNQPSPCVQSDATSTQLSTLTICQVLDIAGGLLIQGSVNWFSPELVSLHKNVISGYVMHQDIAVKVRALSCLSQCCILDKDLAKSFIWMFCSPVQEYKPAETYISEPQYLCICMAAVCDLMRVFGTDLVSDTNASIGADITEDLHRSVLASSSLSSVIQGLVRIMENESGELQYNAVMVLCMLVENGIIRSSNVLCRLFLIWCLPSSAYEDEYGERCKQYVGMLLHIFRVLKTAPEMVQNAFLPTIKTLINAPKTSPHSEVKLDGIIKFILELALSLEVNGTIHDNWAISICTHLRNRPTSKYNLDLSKVLLQLKLNSEASAQDLRGICDDLKSGVRDKFVLRNVYKFTTIIINFLSKNGNGQEEEKFQEEDEEDDKDISE